MNLRHLYFFQELAQTQHMANAAEHLGISQPSLSYAINKLETELGVPLFEREGRNIKLSTFGRSYLTFVNQAISNLNQGENFIRQSLDEDHGHVNLGFTYTLGQRLVPELISRFFDDPHNEQISFTFEQDNSHQLLKQLNEDHQDLVFTSQVTALGETSTRDLFQFTKLVNQELVVITPRNHPLTRLKSVTLADVAKYPLIMYSLNSGLRPLLDQMFNFANITPNIRFEVEEDHTMAGFVQFGLGIAIIPNLPQLDKTNITVLHLSKNRFTHPLYLASRLNHFLPPSVVRFKNFAIDYCQDHFINSNLMI